MRYQGEANNQHSDLIRSAAWNSNGTVLATVGDDKVVKLWLIHEGRTYGYQGETQYTFLRFLPPGPDVLPEAHVVVLGNRRAGRTRRSSPASCLLRAPRARSSSTLTRCVCHCASLATAPLMPDRCGNPTTVWRGVLVARGPAQRAAQGPAWPCLHHHRSGTHAVGLPGAA